MLELQLPALIDEECLAAAFVKDLGETWGKRCLEWFAELGGLRRAWNIGESAISRPLGRGKAFRQKGREIGRIGKRAGQEGQDGNQAAKQPAEKARAQEEDLGRSGSQIIVCLCGGFTS